MILVFCKNEGLWSFHFEFYAMRSNTLFSGNLKQDIEKTLEIIPSCKTSNWNCHTEYGACNAHSVCRRCVPADKFLILFWLLNDFKDSLWMTLAWIIQFQNFLVFYESRWLSCSWADNHTCADGISLWCGGIVEFLLVSDFQIGHLVYESQIKVGIILLCLWRASAQMCVLPVSCPVVLLIWQY